MNWTSIVDFGVAWSTVYLLKSDGILNMAESGIRKAKERNLDPQTTFPTSCLIALISAVHESGSCITSGQITLANIILVSGDISNYCFYDESVQNGKRLIYTTALIGNSLTLHPAQSAFCGSVFYELPLKILLVIM